MSELQAATARVQIIGKCELDCKSKYICQILSQDSFHEFFLKCKSQDGSDLEENIGTTYDSVFCPVKGYCREL